MNYLITSLKQSLSEKTGPSQPPENLADLIEHLTHAAAQRELHTPMISEYCDTWAERTNRARIDDLGRLPGMRGYARELLEERAAIYLDLVKCLISSGDAVDRQDWHRLTEHNQEFRVLFSELVANIADLNQWQTSSEPRCMRCGWTPQAASNAVCPTCQVQCLRPIRQRSPGPNRYVALNDKQGRLFDKIQAILEGEACISELDESLSPLEKHYEKLLRDLRRSDVKDIRVYRMIPLMEQGVESLGRIRRAITSNDAQHIEDGWNALFTTEAEVTQVLPELLGEEKSLEGRWHESTSDMLCFSQED